MWDLIQVDYIRGGKGWRIAATGAFQRGGFKCKDGEITFLSIFFPSPASLTNLNNTVAWMDEEGMADDWLKDFDWNSFSHFNATQETIDRMEEQTTKFFMTHTKAELMTGAIKYRIMLYPISSAVDLLESPQLAARGFWTEVEHPELGDKIAYPGKWANNSETPPAISGRAPLIGEHNQEIYMKELGISEGQMQELMQAGII